MSPVDVGEAITRAHHEEWARVIATLTRHFGDLDVAEEAAAEAFATAVERWPADGAGECSVPALTVNTVNAACAYQTLGAVPETGYAYRW